MASSKRGLWFKFGRFITGLTIACFFLPFFGVSCEGMDVVTVSGADMAGGCKPGGLLSEAADEAGPRGGSSSSQGEMKLDNVPRKPLAIVALALAFIVFGLSWVRSRPAMVGAVVLSIGCLGALTGLYIDVGSELKDTVGKQLAKEADGAGMIKEMKVDAGTRFGLYLACAGLLAGAVLCGLALREPEGTEDMPPRAA
jgi:hypothetical protein